MLPCHKKKKNNKNIVGYKYSHLRYVMQLQTDF